MNVVFKTESRVAPGMHPVIVVHAGELEKFVRTEKDMRTNVMLVSSMPTVSHALRQCGASVRMLGAAIVRSFNGYLRRIDRAQTFRQRNI